MQILIFPFILFTNLFFSRASPDLPMNRSLGERHLPAATFSTFASKDQHYPQDELPADESLTSSWKGIAWKGETISTQIIIRSDQKINNLTVQLSDLGSSNGQRIPKSAITANFIRYVMSDTKTAKGCHIKVKGDSVYIADVIDNSSSASPEANTTQPVWLTVKIPATAAAGIYTGEVKFKSVKHTGLKTLSYSVQVLDRVLPRPKDWKFHLDLWQNPDAIARTHKVKKWSPEHFKVMKPYMQMLADAGQKVITATLIHDPWNSQTYDVYDSMIKWTKKKDGTWNYDYAIFDKWVTYMMDLGIDGDIGCYSMIPWNLKFYYFDEAQNKEVFITAEAGSPEYISHWKPMLKNFAQHLKKKGWFNKTVIAMDERPMEAMQKAIAIIKDADPAFKISLAGNYHPEIEADLYDYSVASNQIISSATIQKRKHAGQKTTFYTCCVERFPNTFTFSPMAEATWLAWHSANKDFDGYLRWAYNSWPDAPLEDSRFSRWPAGDTFLIYPGARSSVRFERLIEGIQDYEKARILKEEFNKTGESAKLQRLESALKVFELDALKTSPASEMVNKAKAVLNSL